MSRHQCLAFAFIALLALQMGPALAGVLPEDRADVLYHVYSGDGITVAGPALLVRKKFGERFGVTTTWDKDAVTGASIDVRASGASELKERRTQWSTSAAYLHGKTTYSASFMNSKETDYDSDNASITVSEDTFGDLTTITLGITRGWDRVSKNTNSSAGVIPMGKVQRRNYRLGLSQILTKKLIATLNYESGALDGYLQNPYRFVRYGASNSTSISKQDELYPSTRTSNAVGIEARYFLPWSASVEGSYRYYNDSWGIVGHTAAIEYVHPIGSGWTAEGTFRYYTQNKADFYADLFPFQSSQTFYGRDKVLATFDDWSLRVGGSYKWTLSPKLNVVATLLFERVQYNYKDYKDATYKINNVVAAPNQQPLFNFGANVFLLQGSVNF